MPVTNKGFGELFADGKNELDHLQKGLASVIPSFPGMPAGKYFDLAIGIDFEPTIMPPCPIFPVPHVGMVFDIMGAIMNAVASLLPPPPPPPANGGEAPTTILSVATAAVNAMKPSVKVHGQWVNNAGTGILHLPGIIIHLLPLAKPMASSEMWMGSSTVLADGGPFSTQFHPALSCNLVGFPSLFRINKAPRPKMALMMPTSMLLAIISGGAPVLVGGPPTIDLFQLALKFGLKGLGKGWKKLRNADAPHTKTPKLASAQPSSKCKGVGEPVDVATGRVYHTNTDVELPGPLPFVWERTYYSDAAVSGPLGYNWHHSYNMGLYNMGNGFFTLRLPDGRETAMPDLYIGEIFYNRKEQLFFERDAEGFFVRDASKLVYRFNGNKNRDGFEMLSSITDVQGNTILFNYDNKGALIKIKDSGERVIIVQNDELGRVTRLYTNTAGKEINLIEYSYDANGNMVKTNDVAGAEKHFIYDDHLLVQLTNQSGMSFYWEYEGKGDDAKCIHTWGDEGVLEYWLQHEEGHTVTRNSLGHVTEFFYDAKKLIYKIIDANGGITRQTYNMFEELAVVVNPEGGSVQYQYNNFGLPVKIVNENEEATNYTYDERLNLTGITTPGGRQVSFKYDFKNRVAEKINTNGNKIYYEYEGLHVVAISDDKKRKFHLHYDGHHNLSRFVYPNNMEQQWVYDDAGNLLRHTDVRGNVTSYTCNNAGQLVEIKEPDGNLHHFAYDKSGNLLQATDLTHEVNFEYGPLGILRSRKQNGRSVRFNYNTELQLQSIINEGGEVYKFGLDALGNVVSEWGFDGLNRRYLRNGNGQVKKVLRPAEKWTVYDYDSIGNIVKEEHSDGSMAAYKYNADGFLTEAFNEYSHIKLQRDKAGRIVKDTQGNYTVTKKYDSEGNCIHTGSSLGADINMLYNEQGLTKAINAHGWQAAFERDNTGLELHRQLSGAVQVQTERDKLGRVVRRSIATFNAAQSRVKYNWGKGNKLKNIVNELTHAQSNFEYDAFDNLISAAYEEKGQTETIYRVPDKIGNLFKTKNRSDRKYSKGGRLQQDEAYNYYYDAEGNLICKEFRVSKTKPTVQKQIIEQQLNIQLTGSGVCWQYYWEGNGMLATVINPHGNKVQFTYDPLGRRIAKQYKGEVTRWVWDGNVPLHEWRYEGRFPPQSNINDSGEITETKEPIENLVTWVFEDGCFVPCAKIEKENEYSIIADYLGTPTHAYNSMGEKVWEREIDCYGKVRKLDGEKTFCPYLYQGQSVDEETGLAYNRFRYYDNESGNYLSQDPIGLAGGNPTLYGYVGNNNAWIDSFGLKTFQQALGDYGEKWAKEQLQNSGKYSRVFQVQNASGHGIDIVGMRSDGKFDVFEVKTNMSGDVGKLSARQLEPDEFINDILTKKNIGSFGLTNSEAKKILSNIGDKRVIDVFVGRGPKGRFKAEKALISDWEATAAHQKLRSSNH
jgi:RHS repeat-associated protein